MFFMPTKHFIGHVAKPSQYVCLLRHRRNELAGEVEVAKVPFPVCAVRMTQVFAVAEIFGRDGTDI